MKRAHQHPLEKILESRIAVIDGAMGTTIRTYGMTEADIRGERFRDSTKSLLNNGDLFSLTKPEMIGDIHRRFLEAGADGRIQRSIRRLSKTRFSAAWLGILMSNRRGSAANGPTVWVLQPRVNGS